MKDETRNITCSKTLFDNLQDNFINDEMGLMIYLEASKSTGATAAR